VLQPASRVGRCSDSSISAVSERSNRCAKTAPFAERQQPQPARLLVVKGRSTFPNSAAVIRLVGAILIDMHDEWIAGDRRYLSEGSMAKLYDTSDDGDLAAIGSGE
jgi:Transposase, Mutator family